MRKKNVLLDYEPSGELYVINNWDIAPIDYELLTRFSPLPVVAYITEEGKLPLLPVQLELSSGLRLHEITYATWIEYNENGRKDKSQIIQGKTTSLNFSLNYGNIVLGGIVYLKVAAVVSNRAGQISILQNTFASSIKGTNPSKETIKNRLGSIELQITAYRESRFRQFLQNGEPLFGPPHGFGIMQIDKPPATAEQIWKWQANVDAGKALFAVKRKDAETYPARVRSSGNPEATDFNTQQLKMETYQRYNGGAYWKWDSETKNWIASPPNNYADSSMEIENGINNGNFPSEW